MVYQVVQSADGLVNDDTLHTFSFCAVPEMSMPLLRQYSSVGFIAEYGLIIGSWSLLPIMD